MYGLDRFSVFVDKRPLTTQYAAAAVVASSDNGVLKTLNNKNQTGTSQLNTHLLNNHGLNGTSANSNGIINSISLQHAYNNNNNNNINNNLKLKLNENNLCNFVTRNNYALFTTTIHLQCTKPLTGRYLYIQADGRSNRWSRLFSAVFCEIQAYEL